ncbi:unnamed protein product [Effrenium voratum]|nr:unnamed protein product [Effrenium voratum]
MGLGNLLASGSLAFSALEYNRDGFASACAMRQNQMYQEKNYHINLIAALREEVRDFMTIFVGRMSNDMIMDTLLFGIATGFLCEGELAATAPDFMVHAYYTCLVLSVVYFGLSMVFAFLGTSLAYSESRVFLLRVVPDPQDKYDFDYMTQLHEFERDPEAFRFPVLASALGLPMAKGKKIPMEQLPRGYERKSAEERTYFEILGEYNSLWEPCSSASNDCMVHGIFSLCQGLSFFILGHHYDRSRWGSVTLFIMLGVTGVVLADRLHAKRLTKDKADKLGAASCVMQWLLRTLTAFAPLAFLIGDFTAQHSLVAIAFVCNSAFHLIFALKAFWARPAPVPREQSYVWDQEAGNQRRSPEPLLQELLNASRANSQKTSRLARGLIAASHVFATLPWLSLATWCMSGQTVTIVEVSMAERAVQWPSPIFDAHGMACAGGRVWLANEFGLFELSQGESGGELRPWACPVQEAIQDVTVDCSSGTCWPLVLDKTGHLVNCSGNATASAVGHSSSVAMGFGGLYLQQGPKILHPASHLEMAHAPNLRTFDVLKNEDVIFLFQPHAVEMQTNSSHSSWSLRSTLRTACAVDRSTILALLQEDEERLPQLSRLQLPDGAGTA